MPAGLSKLPHTGNMDCGVQSPLHCKRPWKANAVAQSEMERKIPVKWGFLVVGILLKWLIPYIQHKNVPPKRAKYHLGAISASINWPETLQKVPPSQMEKYKTVNLLFMVSMFEANLVNKAKCT